MGSDLIDRIHTQTTTASEGVFRTSSSTPSFGGKYVVSSQNEQGETKDTTQAWKGPVTTCVHSSLNFNIFFIALRHPSRPRFGSQVTPRLSKRTFGKVGPIS